MESDVQSTVRCTTEVPEVTGLEKDVLTVGRHFYLNCEGSWNREFDFSKAFAVVDENSKNTIHIFKIEARNANSFDVDLILYVTGEFKTQDFKISDGTHEIDLGPQMFKVKSVIDAKAEKPPEPHGYIVSNMNWPWQYSALGLLILISLASLAFIFIFNYRKWKGRFGRLRQYDSPQAADSQFYKDIRKLEKKDFPIDDLEKSIKLYLLRSYRIPLFEMTNKETISLLKKKYPRFKDERRMVFNLLKDLQILKNKEQSENNKSLQLEQHKKFVDQCYRFVDCTEELKSKGLL
jgi:hypothetical protein